MANLIDTSFFIRDIKIPNVYSPAVAENVNQFIAKYEPQCLQMIMGYPLYSAFLSEPDSQRMMDLKNGASYDAGRKKWMGLVNVEAKDSLIAYYVFYYFEEANATQSTGVATSITTDASAVNTSPADKMVAAWNQFSFRCRTMYDFLASVRDEDGYRLYPEIDVMQIYKGLESTRPINYFSI